METLTDITQAETARRIRARDYEESQHRVAELNRKIEKLSFAPQADAVARLRRIIEDASELPETLLGGIGGLIPLSGVAKTFIGALASSALRNIEGLETRRAADLAAAKVALRSAEEHLAQFE